MISSPEDGELADISRPNCRTSFFLFSSEYHEWAVELNSIAIEVALNPHP